MVSREIAGSCAVLCFVLFCLWGDKFSRCETHVHFNANINIYIFIYIYIYYIFHEKSSVPEDPSSGLYESLPPEC